MTLLIAEEGSMLEDEILDTILSAVTDDNDKMHKNLSDTEVTSCLSLRGLQFLDLEYT